MLSLMLRTPFCCYCCLQVQFVTVPMSNERSGYSLKPNMYAFNENQVATDFYDKRCRAAHPQPTAPAAAQHRRRALLRQAQQGWWRLSSASSSRGNHTAHAVGQHVQLDRQLQQQERSWQQLLRVAQPGLAAVRALLGAGQQLKAAARLTWRQLQQRAASAGAQLQPAAHPMLLPQAQGMQQPVAAAVDSVFVSGRDGAVGVHSEHQSRSLSAADVAADAQGTGLLRGVQLQRLALQQIGTPPEWRCESLQMGRSEMPIPAMKVELFSHMHGVLQHSYEVFRELRERLQL
jgi:hypothetical protein